VRATRDGARPTLARIAVEEAGVLLRDGGAAACERAEELVARAASCCEDMNLVRVGERVRALREQLANLTPLAGAGAGADADAATIHATLSRVGDVWTVAYGGRTLHLNDGRGVRLLALLLERPGTEVHSLDLVAAIEGAAAMGSALEHSGGQETGGRFGVQGSAGPALDAKAKDDYRSSIASLEAQLARAETRHDEAAVRRLAAELEFVRRELGRSVGIGGRDRESGSHAERARVNVTRAIRAALKRLAVYDEQLGAELERSVRTGAFCRYEPDPVRPLRWTVRR
jgi:hypothetical protein